MPEIELAELEGAVYASWDVDRAVVAPDPDCCPSRSSADRADRKELEDCLRRLATRVGVKVDRSGNDDIVSCQMEGRD